MTFFNVPFGIHIRKENSDPEIPIPKKYEDLTDDDERDAFRKANYVDPRRVIIDGANLVKVIEDNPSIEETPLEKWTSQGFVPY